MLVFGLIVRKVSTRADLSRLIFPGVRTRARDMDLNKPRTKPGPPLFRRALPKPAAARHLLVPLWLLGCSTLGLLTGCQTTARLPPVNITEPGWQLREGQSLWRSERDEPEIAGEIIVASHLNGHSLVQFIKTPLPLLTAQTTQEAWRIEFIPEKRIISGKGQPPAHFIWLHLARALTGTPPPTPLRFDKVSESSWRLENSATGELLTVYLNL